MAKKGGKKYYAVRKGRSVGIFETWEECSAQVTGVANEFKSFPTLAEAQAYLAGTSSAPHAASSATAAPAPAAPAAPAPVLPAAYAPLASAPAAYAPVGPATYLPVVPPALPAKRARPEPGPAPTVEEDEIVIFADGSCIGNPGPGGWAYAMVLPPRHSPTGEHQLRRQSGHDPATTNNRMELRAAISGLAAVPPGDGIRVQMRVDSQYVMKGLTEWMPNWKRNGWRTSGGGAVENKGLWEELEAAAARHDLRWHWVKGHSGVPGNELVDMMATAAAGARCGSAAVEGPAAARRLLPAARPAPPAALAPAPPAKRPRPGFDARPRPAPGDGDGAGGG